MYLRRYSFHILLTESALKCLLRLTTTIGKGRIRDISIFVCCYHGNLVCNIPPALNVATREIIYEVCPQHWWLVSGQFIVIFTSSINIGGWYQTNPLRDLHHLSNIIHGHPNENHKQCFDIRFMFYCQK